MKLKYKFSIFIIIIHLILILLSLKLLQSNRILFLVAEFFILISIVISIIIYKQLIRPLNLISSGVEAIKDKDFNMKFVKVKQKEMDELIDVYNKMIDQLREERVMQREQHFFLQKLMEASPSGIIILDFDGNIISVNPSAENFLNIKSEEISGKMFKEINSNFLQELGNLSAKQSSMIYKSGMKTYKCTRAHFVDQGFSHKFIIIDEFTDEIIKTEKQAYGKVIRMMSHEINNSIGAVNSILNSVKSYQNQLEKNDKNDFETFLNIAVERNENLNKFMNKFADIVRIPKPLKKKTNLNDLVKAISTLMDKNPKIKWKLELCKQPLIVELDVQQMELVLINILKNSMEAIEDKGTIFIKTTDYPQKKLIIVDNGNGIDKEIQQNLFTPFFSTKKGGQGIGLTLIREILVNHGFDFSLEMNRKGETEFVIEF